MHKNAKCIQTPALLDCWTAWPIQVAVIWPPEWKVWAAWESCCRTAVFPSWYGEFDKFSCCRIQLKPSSLQGHSMPNEVDGWLLQPKSEARYFIHSLGKQKAKKNAFLLCTASIHIKTHYIEMVKTFIKMHWMQVWWFYFHWAGKLQTFGTPVPSYGASPELTFEIWSVRFVQFVQPFFSIHDTNLSNSTWGQYPGAFVACHPANAKAQHAGACNCFTLKEKEPSELKSSQPMMNCAKLMKRGLNIKTHDGHQSTWISAKSSTLRSGHATFQSFPSKATWDHRSQWQAPGRKFTKSKIRVSGKCL